MAYKITHETSVKTFRSVATQTVETRSVATQTVDADFETDLTISHDYGGQRYYIMYHGTTLATAQVIMREGFRRSSGGMLGPGVYVSRSLEKARRYPLNPVPGERLAILKLKVRMGRVKRIDRQGHPLQETWHQHGYDTAWVPPNCDMVRCNLEEDCVWDPDRIEVLELLEVEQKPR